MSPPLMSKVIGLLCELPVGDRHDAAVRGWVWAMAAWERAWSPEWDAVTAMLYGYQYGIRAGFSGLARLEEQLIEAEIRRDALESRLQAAERSLGLRP